MKFITRITIIIRNKKFVISCVIIYVIIDVIIDVTIDVLSKMLNCFKSILLKI